VERTCTLLAGAAPVEVALKACPEWIVVNDGASGYYRTAPSPAVRKGITEHLDVLSGPEKVATVGDLSSLALAGKLDYAELLALVPALAKDKNVHVVSLAAGTVGTVRDAPLVGDAARPRYAKFIRDAFGARAHALGLHPKPNEDEQTRLLRPTLIELVADQGEDAVLRAECTKLAKAWLADKNAVAPELILTTLYVAAAFGDRPLFDAFLADAMKTPERADRDRLISALGQFRDPAVVEAGLALTLNDQLDARDSIRILWGATRLPETRPQAYAFLTKNFDALVGRLPRDWGAGTPGIGAALCDDGKRAEVKTFFEAHSTKFVGGPRALAQALENMHLCSTFRAAQTPGVTTFFAKSGPR
jgi:alanyl aminopeptidase